MSEKQSRYEEHVIYSYTRICWIFQWENLSIQKILSDDKWPKYFYVIKIKSSDYSEKWIDFKKDIDKNWILKGSFLYIKNLCFLLSVKYWKVFWYLWLLNNWETYNVVDFSQNNLKYPFLPWNNQEKRVDIKEELNLFTNIWPFSEKILNIMINSDEKLFEFSDIAYFYNKWIINSEFDIEISYIDFIRAVEVSFDFVWINDNWEDFFDDFFMEIYEKIKDNSELCKTFRERNWSRQKFGNSIINNLPIESDFWNSTESKWEHFSLKKVNNKDFLIKLLKNVYSIRSDYIHSWISFWRFILPYSDWLNEFINSKPTYVSNLKFRESLTLLWLERIVRAYLLSLDVLD